MATLEFSGIGVTAAVNKLGQSVFMRNKGGQTSRAYVVPVNTITAYRTDARNRFATCCSLWASITEDEFQQWQLFGKRFTKRNSLAQRYTPTARAIFIECNMNLLACGLFPISAPVFNAMPVPLKSSSVSVLSSSSILLSPLFLTGSAIVPANTELLLSASPSVSSGINYPRNNFIRFASYSAGVNVSTTDLFTAYTAIFSSPTPTEKIFFRLRSVNIDSGVASVPLVCSRVVS